MPDSTLSLAIQEAYASAPADVIIYHTLEIDHPAFSMPIRVVRDRIDLTARLEDSAPRNAGEWATFVGYAFDIVPPEVDTGGLPECVVEIDNVSREILANIEATVGSPEMISLTYRQYVSSQLGAPANDPPIRLVVKRISADPFRIRATAGFRDFGNRKFPRAEYTASVFPGLIAQ